MIAVLSKLRFSNKFCLPDLNIFVDSFMQIMYGS